MSAMAKFATNESHSTIETVIGNCIIPWYARIPSKENSHAFKVTLYCLLALSNYQDFYGLPPQTVVAAYFQTF